MHSKIFAVAAGLSFVFTSVGAEAMPAGAISGSSSSPQITLAAGGCGPGMAPGVAGVCHVIRRRAPVVVVGPRVVAPVVVRPRVVGPRVIGRRRPRCGVHVPGVTVVTPC